MASLGTHNVKKLLKKEGHEARFDLETLSHLGDGSTSDVYEVKDKHGKIYAIKISMDGGDAKKRLIEELGLYNEHNLNDIKNVLRLLSPEQYRLGQQIFLLFEVGESLDSKIRTSEIGIRDEQSFIRVANDILSGMIDCRNKGVYHRDIKASNVIEVDGINKLCDFTEAGVELEQSSGEKAIRGTYSARPKEVIDGTDPTRGRNESAEVYSYGHLLYYMWVGRTIDQDIYKKQENGGKEGGNDFALAALIKVINNKKSGPEVDEAKAILERAKAPDYIINAITKCLASNPKERFKNLEELSEALDKTYIESRQEAEKLYSTAVGEFDGLQNSKKDRFGMYTDLKQLEAALKAAGSFGRYVTDKNVWNKEKVKAMTADISARIGTLKSEQEKNISSFLNADKNSKNSVQEAKDYLNKRLGKEIKPEELPGLMSRYRSVALLLDI